MGNDTRPRQPRPERPPSPASPPPRRAVGANREFPVRRTEPPAPGRPSSPASPPPDRRTGGASREFPVRRAPPPAPERPASPASPPPARRPVGSAREYPVNRSRPPDRGRPAGPPEPRPAERPEARRERPGSAAQDEAKLCGLNACLAVFAKRPDDIVRAYVTQAQLNAAGELLSWCAKQHRAYHMVTSEEMGRITQSSHHEGICLLVKPPLRLTLEQLCMRLATQTGPVCVLLLEGITNPHNFGAILRVAAHFGGAAVVQCGTEDAPPRLSAAVCRTAEGAAEQIPVVQVGDVRSAVERLRRCALQVVATSSHATTPIYARGMPRRCLLLLGSEADGLSKELAEAADIVVSVPGTGWVESLNVACATAVLMAEFRRVQPWVAPTPPAVVPAVPSTPA